jgi:hypothetical protein
MAESAGREKKRRISSNSSTAFRPDLDLSQRLCGSIETGIDVLVAIDGAETLRKVHTFIDHNAIRNIDTRLQLVNADQQNAKLDRVQLFERPVDEAVDGLLERFLALADVVQELLEKRLVHALVGNLIPKLGQQLATIVTGYLLLVQSLQQQFARTRACA